MYNDTPNIRPANFGIQSYVQSNFIALIFFIHPALRPETGTMSTYTSNSTSLPSHVQRCTPILCPIFVHLTSIHILDPPIHPINYNLSIHLSCPTVHPNLQVQLTSNCLYWTIQEKQFSEMEFKFID